MSEKCKKYEVRKLKGRKTEDRRRKWEVGSLSDQSQSAVAVSRKVRSMKPAYRR